MTKTRSKCSKLHGVLSLTRRYLSLNHLLCASYPNVVYSFGMVFLARRLNVQCLAEEQHRATAAADDRRRQRKGGRQCGMRGAWCWVDLACEWPPLFPCMPVLRAHCVDSPCVCRVRRQSFARLPSTSSPRCLALRLSCCSCCSPLRASPSRRRPWLPMPAM